MVDLKSSSEQIFFLKLTLGAPVLVLNSGLLLANQIWEFCYSYDERSYCQEQLKLSMKHCALIVSLGAATQLHRGYHTDASPEDRPHDITHLVFVVHGIGQLLHMSNIVRSCAE